MKQQIAVITNTIQNFNVSIQGLRADEDKLNSNIKLFNDFSSSTSNLLNDLYVRHIISEQIFLLSQMTLNLDNYYSLLISSVTLARNEISHPQIIFSQDLFNELNNITLQSG